MLHDEILQEAIDGTGCNEEWVSLQTVRLYRQHTMEGLSHNAAIDAAKQEMQEITAKALRIRRRDQLQAAIAPWCVVVLGALACVGWWYLWE